MGSILAGRVFMWNKQDKETPLPAPAPGAASALPRNTSAEGRIEHRPDASQIGKSLKLKGTISGGEDVYVDGEVEGKVELEKNSLTVGPHGNILADVTARSIIVHGRVKGPVQAIERIELRKTGSLESDLVTARIIVEDGASFRGSIDQAGAVEPGGGPQVEDGASFRGSIDTIETDGKQPPRGRPPRRSGPTSPAGTVGM